MPVLRHYSAETICKSQLQDDAIGFVLHAFESNKKPESTMLQGQSSEVRRLVQLWDQLTLHDGLLYRYFMKEESDNGHLQLVVPSVYRDDILQELHAGVVGGHLGKDKTLCRLKEGFYWPGHWNDVHQWCHTCSICATRKTPSPKMKASLTPVKAWIS